MLHEWLISNNVVSHCIVTGESIQPFY